MMQAEMVTDRHCRPSVIAQFFITHATGTHHLKLELRLHRPSSFFPPPKHRFLLRQNILDWTSPHRTESSSLCDRPKPNCPSCLALCKSSLPFVRFPLLAPRVMENNPSVLRAIAGLPHHHQLSSFPTSWPLDDVTALSRDNPTANTIPSQALWVWGQIRPWTSVPRRDYGLTATLLLEPRSSSSRGQRPPGQHQTWRCHASRLTLFFSGTSHIQRDFEPC